MTGREDRSIVLGGVNFKATLERVRATHTAICISIADVVRATEGDRDTVKRAEKSVDRDGNGEGDGHGHGGLTTYAGQLIGTAHV